jgi:hypothetical protein
MQESVDGIVTLSDDEPEAVACVIEFFYSCDFSIEKATDDGTSMRLCHQVFALADKYLLDKLKAIALAKFEERAKTL